MLPFADNLYVDNLRVDYLALRDPVKEATSNSAVPDAVLAK
jgi:hypothetical protein